MAEQAISFELPVERGKVREFALAVGETNPILFDPQAAREQGLPDVVAPPTFTMIERFQVTPEERARRLGPQLDEGRVLHGEQEFVYNRLPFAGEILMGTMRIASDVTREGRRGGQLRVVTYETVYTDAEGEEVLRSSYTLVETEKDARA